MSVKLAEEFQSKIQKPEPAGVFKGKTTPRILLYFYTIPTQLAAAGIAGVGFVLNNPYFLLSGNLLWIIWFAAMFLIGIPVTDRILASAAGALKKGAIVIFSLILLCGVAEGLSLFIFHNYYVTPAESGFRKVLNFFEHGFGYNDSTALSHQAAENLLEGKNPYENSNLVKALLKFSPYPDRITPLRAGQFADQFPYPSTESINRVWQKAIQDPDTLTPEYANSLVYPAGDFLLPAMLMTVGIKDIRITYAILVVIAAGYVAYRLKSPNRYYFIGAMLMSLELWNSIANGETGSLAFPFLLLAWFLVKRNLWFSALFMGIAVATKQTAWFFLPFYLIMTYRTYTLKRTISATVITTVIFLAANLPFMIADTELWFRSVFTPMNGQMFPLGIGLVTLVTGGILDIRSPLVFDILEFAVLVIGTLWYFRNYNKYYQLGPVLAIFPLFFAWRSLWPYFFYTGIIVLVMLLDEKQFKVQDSNLISATKS